MKKSIIVIPIIIGLLTILMMPAIAQMSSRHFRITTAVLSGGEGAMSSTSFQITSTIGQSSALLDPADPPYSESYDLYPGFWYTIGYKGYFEKISPVPWLYLLLLDKKNE